MLVKEGQGVLLLLMAFMAIPSAVFLVIELRKWMCILNRPCYKIRNSCIHMFTEELFCSILSFILNLKSPHLLLHQVMIFAEYYSMQQQQWWTWWCHQRETVLTLLGLCAGNSPVTGEFPSQRPVTWSFDVFFDLCLNKQLYKKS